MNEYQLQVKSSLHDWEAFGQIYTDPKQAKEQLASVRRIVASSAIAARNKTQYRLVMHEVTPWSEVAE